MFEVGEYIVHPGQGVCRVEGVEDVSTLSGTATVYKLLPVGQRHAMHISYPVAQEARLRPVLSADEARELIASYPSIELDDYTDRSAALEEEHFKSTIKHGSCLDSVRTAKTFRHRIRQVKANNKKPPVAYERILKEAHGRSMTELSVALGCTTDEVENLFEADVVQAEA